MDITQLNLEQAEKKLRKYRVLWVLNVLLLLICIGCLTAGTVIKVTAYQKAVNISPATAREERIAAYLKAIPLYPQKADAYLRLLDTIEEDGIFEKTESDMFLSCYNANHIKLSKRQELYAKLHYGIALMYVNAYPADTTTRLRLALPFFEEAKMYISETDPMVFTVTCYCDIGSYYKNFIWSTTASMKEVNKEQMETLISNIEETLLQMESDTAADAIYNRLGFCASVGNLFYDQRDILAATIAEEKVNEIIDRMYGNLPSLESIQREQTKQMLQELLDNQSFYKDALSRAYERTEAEQQ